MFSGSLQYHPSTIFSMNCKSNFIGSVVNYSVCIWSADTGESHWTSVSDFTCYSKFMFILFVM